MLRVALLLALAAYGAAAAQKPFIDCNKDELVRAVPELAGMQFDPSQDRLDGLLHATGENLVSMFAKLVEFSAAEDVHEMRFEDSMAVTSRHEDFRYETKLLPNAGPEQFEELRIDPNTKAPVQPPAHIDFLVIGHFIKLLDYLLPQYQGQSRFRYLGRLNAGGRDSFVLALAQRPDGTELRSHIQMGPSGQTAPLQGLAWIDAATKRVVRLRTDLLDRIEGFPLETVTTDISLVPVEFKSIQSVLWLPARVTVNARYQGGVLHSVYRYSDYQSESGKSAGISEATADSGEEDAYELLARSMTLIKEGKSGDAIPVLRESLHLNPEMAVARFHLGNALRATGDLEGADAELREAVKLLPESGVVHNLLGIVLAKRGDTPGAVAEFRKSAQLQPKEAVVHVNLAQALEKSGDRAAALEQYRTAIELAPDNAGFKARYEQLEHTANVSPALPAETTIKVDVRQVLVPVIVTDRDGHHVTGLTHGDFQVFEDGVEQKISGFSVEDAGLTSGPEATAVSSRAPEPAPGQAAPATQKPVAVRRSYLVCIDSLHASFGNLAHVRQALTKLFQSEQTGDSQYAVLAIGTSTQLVEDTTSDPEKVLQAIESKEFQKVFLASRKSSAEAEMAAFRRTMEEVREACDAGQPECSRKTQLPSEASQIASADRVYTMSFLTQFHAVVKELSRTAGRRTIVLISDGFQLVPGKLAFELLASYFPEFQSMSLRTMDRMTDLDPVLRLAANSNIPIYTIDSRGLYTSSFFDASNPGGAARLMPAVLRVMNSDASEAGGTLSEIAAATGGTAFQNSNNILTGLERAFADGRQYYMLAYVPANSNSDGRFRAISVKLRDAKMVVKAKRGYWAAAN